jgi:DNA-binding beta-propeller fold protein YncE
MKHTLPNRRAGGVSPLMPPHSKSVSMLREARPFLALAILVLTTSALAEQPKVSKVELVVGSRHPDEGGPEMTPASPLKSPFGLDFDAAGSMFIIELEGGRVFERTPDGIVKQIGGDGTKAYAGDGGPLEKATFNGMHNVAITKGGRMLIADTWNNCVREVDLATRTIRTLAGNGKAGFAGDGEPGSAAEFNFVMCVTLDPAEKELHIADINNHRIRVLNLETNIVRTVAGNGMKGVPTDGAAALESPLVDPRAVAADAEGRVYILERGGHAVRRVDKDGTIRTVVGTGTAGHKDGPAREAQLNSPKHLCVDDQGRVYIADDANAAIRCYDPATETVATLLGRGAGDERIKLKHPHGVTREKGSLYVLDTYHDRIFRLELAD